MTKAWIGTTPRREQLRLLPARLVVAFAKLAPLVVVGALFMASPSSAGANRVFLGKSVYRLFVKGTNGYRLRLSSYQNNLYHRITLTAENELGQLVHYNVEGTPRNGRIDAEFPGLGEIAVAMHPEKVRDLLPPKGCKLPKATIVSGVFVGTIRFRGERKFTTVETDHARGFIERGHRQECEPPPASATAEANVRSGLPSHFTNLQIRTGSVVVYAEGVYKSGKAYFTARAHEERDGMGILRLSPSVSSAGDLVANEELTQATVSPPAPFLGTGTYAGSPQITGCPLPCPVPEGIFLTGSLRIPLPGLGVVPLTGPKVTASLYESTRAY